MIDFEFEFQYAEEKQPALQEIGGSIPAGRCVVLCGGSGCGKSTLLRCINGARLICEWRQFCGFARHFISLRMKCLPRAIVS